MVCRYISIFSLVYFIRDNLECNSNHDMYVNTFYYLNFFLRNILL